MDERKIFRGKFLTLGLTAIIAISVLFISMYEVSASLNIEPIKFTGSNADLKINVTIKNTDTYSVSFNLTLKDTSNDNEDKEVIYSGTLSIDGNKTQSYTFGISGSYDYYLSNPSYWENYRCGNHRIEAKINYGGSTDTESNDVDLDADAFSLTFSPDLETGKITPTTRVDITVNGVDEEAISSASVKISDGDVIKTVGTTNSIGQVSFNISNLFSSASTGTYTLKISRNEVVKEHYYCNYEKEFTVKKKLNITSITPANPKVTEKITLTLDTDDYYAGIWLTIEGPKPQYYTLTDKTFYFTLDTIGTYKISVSKGSDYWGDDRTLVVEENKATDIFDAVEMLEYLSGQKNSTELSHYDSNNKYGYYKFVGNVSDDINLFDVFVLIDRIVIEG